MAEIVPKTVLPRRQLGRTGFEVSVVGVGGWLGLLDDPQAEPALKKAEAIKAVRHAVDLSVNYFDTAPGYGNGEAERHLGLALKALSRNERECLYVSTKVGTHPERPQGYDSDSIFWSIEQSLSTLFADYIDIVYVHDPSTDKHMDKILGQGGAIEALENLKGQGIIGAIGLGVGSHRFLRRAIESGHFDVILTPYDYTLIRASALPVIELAAARGVGVVNGSPYNAGLLAGLDPDIAAARRRPSSVEELNRAQTLWQWCQKRGFDIGALAMQYSLRNELIGVTLAGPRTAQEVEGNVHHATVPLPPDVWDELDYFLKTLGPGPPGGESI